MTVSIANSSLVGLYHIIVNNIQTDVSVFIYEDGYKYDDSKFDVHVRMSKKDIVVRKCTFIEELKFHKHIKKRIEKEKLIARYGYSN